MDDLPCSLQNTDSSDAKCDPDFLKERTGNVLQMSQGYMEPYNTEVTFL